jgi:DNA replication protein DnaD
MGFDTDILLEACNRTMLQTHQASFPYANRILESWKRAGVHSLDDVKIIDKNYQLKKPAAYEARTRKATGNAFHNFEQRSYDYDDLEARLLDLKRSGE